MLKRRAVGAVAILSLLVVAGCEDNPAGTVENERNIVWQQGINSNADNWITDETAQGAKGWCGDIVHFNSNDGPVTPSAGSGYATAAHGECNQYWKDIGFASSGPYAFFGKFLNAWPEGGFVQSLDIYLNPAWSAGSNGSVFTYSNSIRLLDGEYPANLRYFYIPVTKQNENLLVAGNNIPGAGWYTFRVIFSNENGNLAVDFELVKEGEKIFSKELTQIGSGEPTSSFEATNIGNGYAWFVTIAPELHVPVDKQQRLN